VKLLAFDLDGTIVTQNYQLPSTIVAAIGAAREAGHLVTVITGRVLASAQPFLEQLQLETPVGTAQGGCVTHPDGKYMRDLRLSHLETTTIIGRYSPEVDEFFVPFEAEVYVKNPQSVRPDGKPYWDWVRAEGRQVQPFANFPSVAPAKLTLHGNNVVRHLETLKPNYPSHTFYPWGDYFLEVAPPGAHKGAALEMIAAHLGIAQKDTIAFGDGNNDLSMLEWAGYSLAVGETEAHQSGLANRTIAPPEENGVADWIYAWLQETGAANGKNY
jgi:5-amino-6-(5-phospho-D-ribitylamino)uracil phosphatase